MSFTRQISRFLPELVIVGLSLVIPLGMILLDPRITWSQALPLFGFFLFYLGIPISIVVYGGRFLIRRLHLRDPDKGKTS
jgi:hypothetical protein